MIPRTQESVAEPLRFSESYGKKKGPALARRSFLGLQGLREGAITECFGDRTVRDPISDREAFAALPLPRPYEFHSIRPPLGQRNRPLDVRLKGANVPAIRRGGPPCGRRGLAV